MSIGGQSDTTSDRKVYFLTPEGFAKKKERLEYLLNEKSREIADYIHEAKEAGDVSESSAYEDAKNEQAKLNGEIQELRHCSLLQRLSHLTCTRIQEVRQSSVLGCR